MNGYKEKQNGDYKESGLRRLDFTVFARLAQRLQTKDRALFEKLFYNRDLWPLNTVTMARVITAANHLRVNGNNNPNFSEIASATGLKSCIVEKNYSVGQELLRWETSQKQMKMNGMYTKKG